ncbi:MAG TPA: alkaline phosphatase family protein [Acidimicrobiales bacterium]|nr:alkaline phosphatase family protein [Acidimicrobiales bacterium]
MTSPRPVLPDYGGPNITGLVQALLSPAGQRPAWLPAPLADAEQVVLLIVDGLGWLQLKERATLAPCLSSMTGDAITSVVPSTTATALTSITVGRPPAEHGVVGYKVAVDGPTGPEVMNVLRWRTPSGDARGFVQPEGFQPLPPFGGRAIPVVSKAEFNGTGFTVAHQRGAPVTGWVAASSLAVDVRRLVEAGNPFVYAYYEGVDKVAHFNGFGDHYDAELRAVDALVDGLLGILPSGAALAVTADHGQVEVGDRIRVLKDEVVRRTRLISGEARFRWLHAADRTDAGIKELASVATDIYGASAWVVTLEEVEGDGWLGGRLSDEVRARLGDVAVVAHAPVGYLSPAENGEPLLRCRHGSLTPEEMFVPLVAEQGRLGG